MLPWLQTVGFHFLAALYTIRCKCDIVWLVAASMWLLDCVCVCVCMSVCGVCAHQCTSVPGACSDDSQQVATLMFHWCTMVLLPVYIHNVSVCKHFCAPPLVPPSYFGPTNHANCWKCHKDNYSGQQCSALHCDPSGLHDYSPGRNYRGNCMHPDKGQEDGHKSSSFS